MRPMGPCTEAGQLQSEIQSIKSALHRKADKHDIATLSNDVASLACALGELSSVVDGVLDRVQALEEDVIRIECTINEMG